MIAMIHDEAYLHELLPSPTITLGVPPKLSRTTRALRQTVAVATSALFGSLVVAALLGL
jgi:hypothetical protein